MSWTRLAAQFREDAARAMNMAPRELLRGTRRRITRAFTRTFRRHKDLHSDPSAAQSPPRIAFQYLSAAACAQPAVEHYLAHRFDLLGSGWTRVTYGKRCRGMLGTSFPPACSVPQVDVDGRWLADRLLPAHVARAQSIWRLVDWGYDPIDWQLDFKSGYRWSERTWYLDICSGRVPADRKVPWELGRAQHFPQLALAGSLDERPPIAHVREFRNQLLDFIANNPPRMGVQWNCAMDVAIRVVNWLVAFDLFTARGVCFDDAFVEVFHRSVFEHGLHLIENLEYTADYRANHYLANIAGLLFVAAYLESTPTTNAWLAFAVQELTCEVKRQFLEDGGNFEGSTAYHRLSAEIVTYCTALVVGLPDEKQQILRSGEHGRLDAGPGLRQEPLPFFTMPGMNRESPFDAPYWRKLERMAELVISLTNAHGEVPQIGDNDSGRFLKLVPAFDMLTVSEARRKYAHLHDYRELSDSAEYCDANVLDQRHLVAAMQGFFSRNAFAALADPFQLETQIIRQLAKLPDGQCIVTGPADRRLQALVESAALCSRRWPEPAALPSVNSLRRHVYAFHSPLADLLQGLELHCYPHFGLYVYRSPALFLCVRAEQYLPAGSLGHRHYDALAVELMIDGQALLVDPGSYLYTASPAERLTYRSRAAHFVPRLPDDASESRSAPLFRLPDPDRVIIERVSQHHFQALAQTCNGRAYRRTIWIHADRIVIEDEGDLHVQASSPAITLPVSPGYGMLRATGGEQQQRRAA